MPGIIVFSEDGALVQQLLTPALELKKSLNQPVTALTTNETAANTLATLGADLVVLLKAANSTTEALAPEIAEFCAREQASVVLIGGTLRGKHVAAQVAARLEAGMTTDAKALKIVGDKLECTRILYAGLAVCEEELSLPAVATIPARTFLAPASTGTSAKIETLEVKPDARIAVSSTTSIGTEGVDITAAHKLVCVGRGFRAKDDLKLAEDLAAALKDAELACTRGIAEDEHWLPLERYIGISGQTVKPELYVAAGLSGQVQHMVGCRESKVIVAINNDERAPIFEAADYGIVGDLYTVLPLLTAALKN
ncbi:MAG TPA: electron transfer flavoprotein subunit alpha/FixB family protein [candidate division Zixibacteria bacterium]|nr:electron transfer flavoprotein subunit alpha/FixB family protein [candidate division Zixibacteria bacterium]